MAPFNADWSPTIVMPKIAIRNSRDSNRETERGPRFDELIGDACEFIEAVRASAQIGSSKVTFKTTKLRRGWIRRARARIRFVAEKMVMNKILILTLTFFALCSSSSAFYSASGPYLPIFVPCKSDIIVARSQLRTSFRHGGWASDKKQVEKSITQQLKRIIDPQRRRKLRRCRFRCYEESFITMRSESCPDQSEKIVKSCSRPLIRKRGDPTSIRSKARLKRG